MANFVYNSGLGQVRGLFQRVEDGDPANSRVLVVAVVTTESDATLKDLDDLGAVLGNANTAEATNSGYDRKTLAAADISIVEQDASDLVEVHFVDQVWSAVGAGDNWTDLVVCYIPDGVTPGADSTAIVLTQHDFAVTPDGSDITADVGSAGFFQAS